MHAFLLHKFNLIFIFLDMLFLLHKFKINFFGNAKKHSYQSLIDHKDTSSLGSSHIDADGSLTGECGASIVPTTPLVHDSKSDCTAKVNLFLSFFFCLFFKKNLISPTF